MHRIYNSVQAAATDGYSIEKMGIPSLVLMERAALAVTAAVKRIIDESHGIGFKVLCVSGPGNNGADAVAVARQLNETGVDVSIYLVSENEDKYSKDLKTQLSIARNLKVKEVKEPDYSRYEIIVDGMFGNGLMREVKDPFADVIKKINNSKAKKVAIDVPSGINASTGNVLGTAVKADATVTFGTQRVGLILYPGADHAGKIITANIGFAPEADLHFGENETGFYLLDEDEILSVPERKKDSNKGTYGKALIVAGSENMGGALIMSSTAAFKTGAGLIKTFSHKNNREIILNKIPEVIPITYDNDSVDLNRLGEEVRKSDAVLVGPGLSTGETAEKIVATVLANAQKTLIIDADGLNIISGSKDYSPENSWRKNLGIKAETIIITPHLKEMSRLTGKEVSDIKKEITDTALEYANKWEVTPVLKDSRTVISDGSNIYINNRGNSGMAKAGSGDVLAGILTGLGATGLSGVSLACTGVYLHAVSGDLAAEKKGEYGMLATDIVNEIKHVIE